MTMTRKVKFRRTDGYDGTHKCWQCKHPAPYHHGFCDGSIGQSLLGMTAVSQGVTVTPASEHKACSDCGYTVCSCRANKFAHGVCSIAETQLKVTNKPFSEQASIPPGWTLKHEPNFAHYSYDENTDFLVYYVKALNVWKYGTVAGGFKLSDTREEAMRRVEKQLGKSKASEPRGWYRTPDPLETYQHRHSELIVYYSRKLSAWKYGSGVYGYQFADSKLDAMRKVEDITNKEKIKGI